MLRRVLLAIACCFAFSPAVADDNVLVVVDLKMQTMHVRVDGVTQHRWNVSTGRAGFETPPGRYQPTRMYRSYFSRTYDNAPMPHSIFFFEGYAIHGTMDLANLGNVASHGCVRLAPENAEALFALVKAVGPENTIIRVRTHSATIARIEEPAVVEPETEAAEVVETSSAIAVEALVTGSTGYVDIPWMRPGLNG